MISGLSYTVKNTGFLSLYRGLAPTLIGSVPKAGIRFGLNSVIKDKLRDKKDGTLTPGKNFLAGLGAGVTEALIIVAPVETVKTKCIELNQPFVTGLKHILKNEGLSGVYQGAFATALKQGSNQGLRFMWFNEYKQMITKDGEIPLTPIMGLFGGMSAGCFSTLGNNPFDVVKVRSGVEWGVSVWMPSFLSNQTTLIDTNARHQGLSIQKHIGLFQTNFNQRRHWCFLCRCGSSIRPCRTRSRYYLYEF